ncbi:MAG: fatty acid desaturase [Bdellovibrionales bacterium]
MSNVREVGVRVIQKHGLLKPDDRLAALLVADVILTFSIILVVVWLAPVWLAIPLGWLLAIRFFNCAAQISHVCGHHSFLTKRHSNDRVGTMMSAAMGYKFVGHNEVHDNHHRYLNTPKDGDVLWGRPEQTRTEFLRDLALDLIGYQAFKRFLQYGSEKPRRAEKESSWQRLSPWILIALVQVSILAMFSIVGGPWAYLVFYVLPICTLYPAQARIRSLAEHHIEPGTTLYPLPWLTRNTEAGFIEQQVIGPFYQNYHLEHHLFPKVPGYFLKRLHHLIAAEVTFERQTTNSSYLGFMIKFLLGPKTSLQVA